MDSYHNKLSDSSFIILLKLQNVFLFFYPWYLQQVDLQNQKLVTSAEWTEQPQDAQ